MAVQDFANILDAGLRSADLGLIPPALDQVLMGDITRSRFPELKALWVLGANDGVLPPPSPSTSLLTEDEREKLRKQGLHLAPGLVRQMNDNWLALYGALCQPKEQLILSYSRATSEGKLLRPSTAILRLKKIFPKLEVEEPAPIEEREAELPQIILPLSDSSISLQYGESGGVFEIAASQLEAYAMCPFAYFMNKLKAHERQIYQVRPVDLGILYHEVLARATQDPDWHRLDTEGISKLVHTHAEAVINGESDHVLQSSARNMYILKRVKEICNISLWALSEQYNRGEYIISGTETGAGTVNIPLDNGMQMVVTGRIDRVDTFGDYLKIIDYKSGSTTFSLEEMRAGTQLQLMLYMNSLLKPENKPGGVFYFNIDDPILRTDSTIDPAVRELLLLKEFRMSGLALSDPDNIAGLDKHLQSGEDSLIIPVSMNKDGSFAKKSQVANAQEFAQLRKEATDTAKRLGEEMSSGVIAPVARKSEACKRCKFAAICGES